MKKKKIVIRLRFELLQQFAEEIVIGGSQTVIGYSEISQDQKQNKKKQSMLLIKNNSNE